MIIEPLETWLRSHTNILNFFNSDNEMIIGNIEFKLNIPYLFFNKLSSLYYNAVVEDLKKAIIECYNLDDECLELITTERLIHPVLLSQHLQQKIINMEKELTELTMKRLNDTVENLELIHIY